MPSTRACFPFAMALAQSVLFILINESCPLVGLGPAGFLDVAFRR